MNKRTRRIIHKIGNVPGLKIVKHYLLYIVNPIEEKIKRKRFLENGLTILNEFDNVLSSNNICYSLVFGTLLGAVREKGFIKHDLDIDVAVWYDYDYKLIDRLLMESGFQLIRHALTDDGRFGRELTYSKNGVQIDIFFFYPYDDINAYTTVYVPFPGCDTMEDSIKKKGGMMPIQLILPFSHEYERIPFESLRLPVIKNRIEFLEARYGKNWTVPDPTFVYPKMGDVKCLYREDKITVVRIID